MGHASAASSGSDAEHHGQMELVAAISSAIADTLLAGRARGMPEKSGVGAAGGGFSIPHDARPDEPGAAGYSHSIVAGGFDEMS